MKKLFLLLLLIIFSCDSPTGLNDDEFIIEFKHYYCGTKQYTSHVHYNVVILNPDRTLKKRWDYITDKKEIITIIDDSSLEYYTYLITFNSNNIKEGTIIFGEKDIIYTCI